MNKKRGIYLVTVLLLAIILAGCNTLLDRGGGVEGKIVMTLSRGTTANSRSYSTFFNDSYYSSNTLRSEFDPASINPGDLPRSISKVLANIQGYLLRIKGGTLDQSILYLFEEDQDVMSVEMNLPSGINYTVTLLALAEGAATTEKILLGAGSEGFVVSANQTSSVQVQMLPYKYALDFNQSFTTSTEVPVSHYILGPLMSDLFIQEAAKVYLSKTAQDSNINQQGGQGIDPLSPLNMPMSDIEGYDCYQYQVDITGNSTYFNIKNDGLEYQTYLQLELTTNTEWQVIAEEAGLSKISCLYPDLIIDQGLMEVVVNPVEANHAPEINLNLDLVDNNKTIGEGENLNFTVTAYDQDDDPLTFSASGVLAEFFNPQTRIFDWTPIDGQNGTYNITFAVSDGELVDEKTVSIIVNDTVQEENVAPVLHLNIEDVEEGYIEINEGETLNFTVTATDENDDTLTFWAEGQLRLQFDPDTQEFSWTPVYGEDGSYDVTFKVSDGELDDSETVTVGIYLTSTSDKISTVVGTGEPGYNADEIVSTTAQLYQPYGVAVDSYTDTLYIADTRNNLIRKVEGGVISTFAGGGDITDPTYEGLADEVQLNEPKGVAVDMEGNLYIADTGNNIIRKVSPDGWVYTVLGGEDGDPLNEPYGVAVDGEGNIFVADTKNNLIRMVDYSENISIIAGGGNDDSTYYQGLASGVKLSEPHGIAIDSEGNLYIADNYNYVVRRVNIYSYPLMIETVAGTDTHGYNGNGGVIADTPLGNPVGLAVDRYGFDLYIADYSYEVIWKVGGLYQTEPFIERYAGDLNAEESDDNGDGGPSLFADLFRPGGVAVDEYGNLYIADTLHNVIRKVPAPQ